MADQARALLREASAGFAVLAIYILTLLVPLHQSANTQRDFAALGYQTAGAWSICTPQGETDGETESPSTVICPLAGLGKQLSLDTGMPPAAAGTAVSMAVAFDAEPHAPPQQRFHHKVSPRAPPVRV